MIDIELDEEVKVSEKITDSKKLILHNDDVNSFDYVIDSLVKVCKHTVEQATQCSFLVHYNKRCVVKEKDTEEKLKIMKSQLQSLGLSVTLE